MIAFCCKCNNYLCCFDYDPVKYSVHADMDTVLNSRKDVIPSCMELFYIFNCGPLHNVRNRVTNSMTRVPTLSCSYIITSFCTHIYSALINRLCFVDVS